MFFEVPDASDQKKKPSRAVSAEQLADLVNDASIPVVILNACQSGKQETEPETNLASRLAQAGVQAVLAMAYSVTVSAARNFMEAFYREAFNGKPLSEAITRARQTLLLNKARNAYFGLTVDLEDWMLPVLYENEAVQFQIRATEEERRARLKRSNELFHAHPTKHRFWGRDLDILNIERRILSAADRNILLIEGMGGTGKSTLLQHLGWWWQTTGLISRVFNFEYDQKPWTRQQILHEISRALDLRTDPNERFHQEEVVSELQSHPYLLVLDNLESVTGEQLAIGQSLSQAERQNLHEFLQKLRGAKTLVLVGSRSKEEWLGPGTFGDNIHPLRGLDPEARSGFADEVLRAVGADPNQLRSIPEYRELLSLLGGHPLAMQVILSNLGNKTPAEVLSALREGDVKLDHGETRTESILKCIDYSHNNLSPEARSLLECFAPFTSVVLRAGLDQYVRLLREQPELAALPWERLPNVLKEAERWGLVREEGPFLHLQPVLPFFLRSRADSPDGAARKRAVEEAFRKHYNGLCQAIYSMQRSKEPAKRQTGQLLAQKERENVLQALHLSLAGRESILNPYKVLDELFGQAQDHAAGLLLAQKVTFSIENYPPELLAGPLGLEMVGVLDDAASHLLHLKKFADAETGYRRALALLGEKKIQAGLSAGIYHQLGNVALEQRQWGEAERNYREALRIKVEFNDRYSRASTYHQLGRVAEEQRQWAEAEKNYREALRIYVEFNDRYEQAGTYHQLGSVAQAQRQWGEAEKNYREALRIKVESNDRYSQASTYHQLGMVAEEQRQWAEAEKNYREALRIYVEFNDRYAQASTYHQLGRVAQERRQWGEAEKHYREALRIYVEFNDRYAQAGTYHQLGRVAQERRQWGEAEKHYREALRIY
ncbi:MAG: tetratricopeptide repeat protein, partial [Acidobacteriia bacterium]|nr:tetratricopeptide repeat protein [Terriglobia bacterium]